ncbi:MAG: tetratricopeptide repeat protein [Thermoproteota archaeon]|nr:tetratricopeptide repeat protein [Thermoproteota archaeon]
MDYAIINKCSKRAKGEYNEAIKSNSKSVKSIAYYNLGVLYNNENKQNTAKKLFRKCLNINPSFSMANEAINKLDEFEQSEWYNWWFGHSIGKKILGMLLILSLLSPMLIVAIIVQDIYFIRHDIDKIKDFVSNNISVLIVGVLSIMGLTLAVLLLPSLTKIKVGNIVELETTLIHAVDIKFESFVSMPSLMFVNMPTEIPIQYFHMPLHLLHMPIKYPLKSTPMPLQLLHRYWDLI